MKELIEVEKYFYNIWKHVAWLWASQCKIVKMFSIVYISSKLLSYDQHVVIELSLTPIRGRAFGGAWARGGGGGGGMPAAHKS